MGFHMCREQQPASNWDNLTGKDKGREVTEETFSLDLDITNRPEQREVLVTRDGQRLNYA